MLTRWFPCSLWLAALIYLYIYIYVNLLVVAVVVLRVIYFAVNRNLNSKLMFGGCHWCGTSSV